MLPVVLKRHGHSKYLASFPKIKTVCCCIWQEKNSGLALEVGRKQNAEPFFLDLNNKPSHLCSVWIQMRRDLSLVATSQSFGQ